MKRDCICAPATPGAVSALCVVRISGEGAKRIASGIFTPRKGGFPLKDRKLYYGDIADNGQWLDEVLLWCFSAPHSYTGEEMVEISCH
ncbi:MAG: tRNA uridine-5-carboxymethylaminomethyl(34) synthesis GTPase MnmE, partial [Bacteroidales bacterium]|nr:tRNA uridine-5-carboxymethylaminomethyl(34) synthesis GTPase MnmE [Bacteroidales bacterium]